MISAAAGRSSTIAPQTPPCGAASIVVDFAGGPYRFVGCSARQRRAIHDRFGSLDDGSTRRIADHTPMTIAWVQAVEPRTLQTKLRGEPHVMSFEFAASSIAVKDHQMKACLVLDQDPSWIEVPPTADSARLESIAENFLRVAAAYRVLESGGVILHSAALARGGSARVFVGRSGAGKSTLSGLGVGAGYRVLSDELNAIWCSNETCRVESVPFAGNFGRERLSAGIFRLEGLYRLEQGLEDHVRPVGPAKALATLFAASPFVNGDPYRQDRLWENLKRIRQRARMRELEFSLTGRCFEVLEHDA